MAYIYAYERKKFEEEWAKKEAWYRAEGMEEDAIHELYLLDLAEFNSNRRYYRHNVSLTADLSELANLLVDHTDFVLSGRYDWIEELDEPELVQILRRFPGTELELLTEMICDDLTQSEIARANGVSRQAVNEKVGKIRKYFEKLRKST